MEIEYTIKIKDKHLPQFKKGMGIDAQAELNALLSEQMGMGKGIVAKVTIDFKQATEENFKHPRFLEAVYARGRELLDDYFEISFDHDPFNIK